MNKTAAVRSQARRAALTKVALDNVGSEIGGGLLTPVTAGLAGAGIGALAKMADGVSDWVDKNLPDYTPQERLVQELQAKKDRGIGIEKYRTSDVGNWAGILGSATAGTLGTAYGLGSLADAAETGRLRGAKDWIRSVKKLAPGFSARHGGVAKAIGRLANTATGTGLVAATLLPLVGGVALGGKFGARRQVNKAIDQVQGTKKAAEAAFAEGFCKAAEIAGVNPGALAKAAALRPGAAFRLVRTALEGRRGSELGGKVLATHSFLSGTGRLSRGTADNLAHMLRLDEAIKRVNRAGYLPYKGSVTLPDLVRAAHLDIPAHAQLSGAVTRTPRSEAVKALLREMGYGK